MTKSLLLLLLCAEMLSGQAPVITQGPFVGTSTITRSSASIAWTTDIPATNKIIWATAAANVFAGCDRAMPASCNVSAPIFSADWATYVHNWYLYGTPANTQIHYAVCSMANLHETCSSVHSYTSGAQTVVPADPVPPTPVDTPTVPTGTIWTVGADCNDPATGLVAQWRNAQRGDIVEIDPAITPYCAGSFAFPAKPSGGPYILTRVKGASTLFPNYRRANPGDKPKMARFIHNSPNVEMNGSSDPSTVSCFAGSLHWRQGQGNAWAMYRCNNVNPQAITGITSTGNVRLTVPGHGIPEGWMTWVSGVTGAGAASVNGAWKAHVVDANTVELHPYYDTGALQASGSATGGTIALNRYTLEPVTEGPLTAKPATCTFGTWWHQQAGDGAQDEYSRTYYCDAPNELLPFRLDVGSYIQPMPVIDVASNGLDHLMFQGLNFEPMHLKADAKLTQYIYDPTHTASGSIYWSFVGQTIYNHHIYWDNIVAGCPDPSLSGEIERCDSFALAMDGSHIHIGGSYLYGYQIFQSLQNFTFDGVTMDDSAVVIPVFQGGPLELLNNYIECAGICVYASADENSTTETHDWTLRRNTIESPDKYWKESSPLLAQGFYFSQRHRSERKMMHREEDDGNIFIGGWATLNNAAGYCLCSRTTASETGVSAIADTVVTGYVPTAVSHGWMFNDVQAGDLVHFINQGGTPFAGASGACAAITGKLYTVTAVTDALHISISPGTGCNAGPILAYLQRVNTSSGSIRDIHIHNQTWLNNPTDLVWLGHDSNPGSVGAVLQRVKLANNLSIGVDGTRVGRGQYFVYPSTAPTGNHLNLDEGGEDFQEIHETVYGRTLATHMVMDYLSGGASAASGLVLRDNITEYLAGTGATAFTDSIAYGKAFFDREWIGTNPAYTLAGNVILRPGGCGGAFPSGDPCAGPPGPAPFGPYPSGFRWFDTTLATFPYFSAAQNNYRLRPSSAYASGGAIHATDGTDVGVDMDALEAAQGKVSNVRAFDVGSTTATIGFLAPDAVGCPVDWSVDNWATSSRVSHSGGERVQNVVLTGLPPHSTVQYRVVCVVVQPVGTFSTR